MIGISSKSAISVWQGLLPMTSIRHQREPSFLLNGQHPRSSLMLDSVASQTCGHTVSFNVCVHACVYAAPLNWSSGDIYMYVHCGF